MHSSALLHAGASMETLLGGGGGKSRVSIIGHRGCGKNKLPISGILEESMPSIMENTIVSFNLAASSGADFVEFDVQVTRDGHPVIFHDDLIIYNEKKTDCLVEKRICDLTLDEFLSIGYQKDSQTVEKELLRKTADGSLTVWNASVNDSLCTLKEAFHRVSRAIGFNIELKFDDYNPIAHWDLKAAIQSVLEVVHENAMERKVFFSTFHPDAALLVRQHQSIYPVLFLTDGVPNTYPDIRRNSLAAAIEVCLAGNLQGIVSEVKAILNDPEAVQKIKAAQLTLLTYGEYNNLPEILYLQHELNVDGLVVDHVSKMVLASLCKSKGQVMTSGNGLE